MQITRTQKQFVKIWNKNLGEHHDLYIQSNALLLADVFGNFRKMCLEKYELDPGKFLPDPRLACKKLLKRLK